LVHCCQSHHAGRAQCTFDARCEWGALPHHLLERRLLVRLGRFSARRRSRRLARKLMGSGLGRCFPSWSAAAAPRSPMGLEGPMVLSFSVCCSSSEFSSAPSKMASADRNNQSPRTTAPPRVPYVLLNRPKLAA